VLCCITRNSRYSSRRIVKVKKTALYGGFLVDPGRIGLPSRQCE
jgi:hypothetical protein